MSQNTYVPPAEWFAVDSTETLTAFNPDRVAELVNAAFIVGPDGVGYLGTGPEDTLVEVYLPPSAAQDEIDAAIVRLNAICIDPTRNDLTAEQQEAADLATELAQIQTRIDAVAADIIVDTGDNSAVPPTTGLKGTLQAANWNTLTDPQKIALLRTNQQAIINNQLDLLRLVRYLLRQTKQDKTGISTMAATR